MDQRIDDLHAVLEAVGSQRAVVLGISEGVQLSIAFAARYPERTRALVLYGGAAGAMRAEQAAALTARIAAGWGAGSVVPAFAPSVAGDERARRWLARMERLSATPASAAALLAMLTRSDVHDLLPAVLAPTLVLHRTDDTVVPCAAGRALARRLASARFVEQPGRDHLPMFGDADGLLDEIERFLEATIPRAR
jgi:pimeloyl-ACP methyl ester carboxylesterase